jgi:hypothetical protein
MSDSERLERVAEEIRSTVAPGLRPELVRQVAAIAVQNQFAHERAPARSELRALVAIEVELSKSGTSGAASDDDS